MASTSEHQPAPEPGVSAFVENMAAAFESWGFPRMPARVLMILMTAPAEGLSTHDLQVGLGISPAATSNAVSYLQNVGLVERRRMPGSRRHRYVLPSDTWYTASMTKSGALTRLADLADEGVVALGGAEVAPAARVAEMAAFFRFTAGEMDGLLDRWHAERAAAAERHVL
jgi:predicted transcriptional regulator